MTMIERIARAMYAVEYDAESYSFDAEPLLIRRLFLMMAEAALQELRVPNEAMLMGPDRSGHECYNVDDDVLCELFQGMIDAALGEEGKS